MNMFEAAWLIHIGTVLLLIGYVIRDELKLRVMIIISNVAYNLYYWLVPSPPLWDAVVAGFLLITANIWVLTQVLLDRTTFRLSDDEKRLFIVFSTFTPGQFRRLLKLAKWREVTASEGDRLTTQDELTNALFFIFDGQFSVEKDDHTFMVADGNFVGEIGYVQKGVASATTIALPGTRYVEWNADDLRGLEERSTDLSNALNARLTDDLAQNLASSVQYGASWEQKA